MSIFTQVAALTSFVPGSYVPVDSFVHRLDPRAKLVGLLVLLAGILTGRSWHGLAGPLACLAAAVLLTGLGPRVWWSCLWRFRWMIGLAGLVNLVFPHAAEPGIRLAGFELPFGPGALSSAAFLSIQIAAAVTASMVMSFSTTPGDITKAIRYLARPLERLGIRVEEYALVFVLAMRFLPVIQYEAASIAEAQKARGIRFDGRFSLRVQILVSVLVPALFAAIRRAEIVAVAMTARGFRPGMPRSDFRPLAMRGNDWAALVLAFAAGCLSHQFS